MVVKTIFSRTCREMVIGFTMLAMGGLVASQLAACAGVTAKSERAPLVEISNQDSSRRVATEVDSSLGSTANSVDDVRSLDEKSLQKAKIILISDIDDTIKMSAVLKMRLIAINAFRYQNKFLGASPLYQLLKFDLPKMKFFYLSKAPKELMGEAHEEFLRQGEFPEGKLITNSKLYSPGSDFKVQHIREILKNENPDVVILVGDNGEMDVQSYAKILNENRNNSGANQIRFLTYIHHAYDRKNYSKAKRLADGQKGFVSFLDLAVELAKEDVLSRVSFEHFVTQIAPKVTRENIEEGHGTLVFPEWFTCAEFKLEDPSHETLALLADGTRKVLDQAYAKIRRRCRDGE